MRWRENETKQSENRLGDVGLESAQEKRSQHFVQLVDHLVLLRFVVEIEPGVKVVGRRKHVGQQEVQERPEFVQVVLQGRASEQQSIRCCRQRVIVR